MKTPKRDRNTPISGRFVAIVISAACLGGCASLDNREDLQQADADRAIARYVAAAACHGRNIDDNSPQFAGCVQAELRHGNDGDGLFASLF